jgi:uncharacterized membrane protein
MTERTRPGALPSLLMGIGFGGFIDGIVLHQILQWHHLLTDEGCCPSSTVAGLEDNTLADGLFHLATWIALLAGTLLAVRGWQRGELAPPWRSHLGGLLLGWGLFNLVEGLVDHQLLGIHHVRDDLGGPLGWDLGFLLFGAALAGVGVALMRSGRRRRMFERR